MGAAGSDVLRRYSPAGQQNLVFSLKQAGVPIGGVLAGLLLPWLDARLAVGWTLAVCAALVLGTSAAIQPLRRQLDTTRDPQQSIRLSLLLSPANLQRPLRALGHHPNLLRVAIAGACFGVGQGVWFTFLVSHLVVHRGLSLAAAGALFAVMLVVSTMARPLLGWVADRLGAGRVLRASCVGSALATVALAFVSTAWPDWAVLLLVLAAGLTVSSWNGVQGAQAVQFARPGAVGEAATGAGLMIMIANVLGPALFGLMAALGGFTLGFLVAAAITLAAMWTLWRLP
jgi:nitrate/nitrite transporter NarK